MKKRWKNPNVIALGVENTYDIENCSIAPPFPSQDGKQPTRIKCGLCEKVFESVNIIYILDYIIYKSFIKNKNDK